MRFASRPEGPTWTSISRRRLLTASVVIACEALPLRSARGAGRGLETDPESPGIAAGHGKSARHVVLGQYVTYYEVEGEHRDRAGNLTLAANAINGTVLGPSETFSFNSVVGERTAAFGFRKSPIIRDGLLTEGTGGGACQIASTLHAAALLAGFLIVQRQPHSRPSAYIPMTLDATVAYPRVDLRLRNPYSYRTRIHAHAARGEVRVALVAEADGDPTSANPAKPRTSITIEVLERTAFARTIERDPSLPAGTISVKAFGIPGFRVRRIRERQGDDGRIARDLRLDTYPPTTEIVSVPPAFDPTILDGIRDLRTELRAGAEDRADTGSFVLRIAKGVHRPTAEQVRPQKQIVIGRAVEEPETGDAAASE